MKKIKIIRVPYGEAPEWVKKEWIGLKLPLTENKPKIMMAEVQSITVKKNDGNWYSVEAQTALKILRKKSPEAAEWWENKCRFFQIPISGYQGFAFHKDNCELVN